MRTTTLFGLCFLFVILPLALSTGTETPKPECRSAKKDESLRTLLPPCWYQQVAGWEIVTFKKHMHYGHELSLDPNELSLQLDQIKGQGIQAIEIFAPAEGRAAYNGLDTVNHFRIDPEVGTIEDFRRAVRLAHSKGIAVVVFINLGYFSVEAPDWLEAVRDKRAGHDTPKVRWFLWSDKADTPPPRTQEDIYVTPEERDRANDYWGWKFSEKANTYYWARWKATGKDGTLIPLPQLNWGSAEWREQAAQVVRFWMDTGIDGMLIDAPLCYPNQTWAQNRKYITDIIRSYGNVFMDPEGGRDSAWITEAGYDVLHDYGLSYAPNTFKWQGDIIEQSVKSGDPSEIELRLRSYHDPILDAGAVLYAHSMNFAEDPVKRHLQQAVLAGIGDIIVYGAREGSPDAEESKTLQLKAAHPALFPTATRRRIRTNADDKYYAILKTAKDGLSERVLAVYNFQSTGQTIHVDLSIVDTTGIVDLENGELKARPDVFQPVVVELPGYGYGFYKVLPPER